MSDKIRADIDARLDAIWDQIVAAQESYRDSRGKYAQILPTHSVPPADGVDTPPDRLDEKPHYQAETARQLAGTLLRDAQMSSLRIDQYRTPDDERGWVVTLTARMGGETWSRSVNVGPEKWRTREWERVEIADAAVRG